MNRPFDVFSKRIVKLPEVFEYDVLPDKLRNQLVILFDRTIFRLAENLNIGGEVQGTIRHLVARIGEEHGLNSLDDSFVPVSGRANSPIEQLRNCIWREGEVGIVLDAVEWLCIAFLHFDRQYEFLKLKSSTEIATLNYRFRENGIGYEFNIDAKKIIRIDSTLLHQSSILPSLSLLTDPLYSTANSEFVIAFEDYKKGDYDDCAVKSCSAFESTLKVICTRKGWAFDPNKDTCSKLVEIVVKNGNLDSFLTEPFKLIGSIRNKLSAAHGGGTSQRVVTEEMARYCLNSTASAILYMVEATR